MLDGFIERVTVQWNVPWAPRGPVSQRERTEL